MKDKILESIWNQFGASIDMLLDVIENCPNNYLTTNKRFYYLTYHTIVFLDYYLTIPLTEFSPILSFTFTDKEQQPIESIGDMVPDKIYSTQELIDYVKHCRLKCKNLIESITNDDILNKRFTEGEQEGDMDYPIVEILLYNLRHTQHHTGQLNLLMRQDLNKHLEWAFSVQKIVQ